MSSSSPLMQQAASTQGLSTRLAVEPPEPQDAEPLLVLHIEDNPADALLAQEYLRSVQPDVQFDAAVRLDEVTLERAAAARCAILDLSLPDASGLEGLIAIRAMSEALPIIVLTGVDDLELAVTALRFGADDYLVKNHVDGDTLQRSIRYSIERRRLRLDLATELAATTVAAATVITAEAALDAELMRKDELAGGAEGTFTRSEVLLGTHEVAVRIDDATGDYALECRSCDWKAARGSDDLHSWAERSLDLTLLYHVDFGDLPREASIATLTATQVPEAAGTAEYGPRMREERLASPPSLPLRRFFSPAGWIMPHDKVNRGN